MTAAKFVLYIICRRVATPSAQVLAIDHRNDVISNTVAVTCGIIGIELRIFLRTNIKWITLKSVMKIWMHIIHGSTIYIMTFICALLM